MLSRYRKIKEDSRFSAAEVKGLSKPSLRKSNKSVIFFNFLQVFVGNDYLCMKKKLKT